MVILGDRRFKAADVPTNLSKGAPEFCSVYVISKGKISSVRSASIPVPNPPPRPMIQNQSNPLPNPVDERPMQNTGTRAAAERTPFTPRNLNEDMEIKSPFNRNRSSNRSYGGDTTMSDTDISFVSSGRPSTERMYASPYDSQEVGGATPRLSYGSDTDNRSSFGSPFSASKSPDPSYMHGFSSSSENTNMSWSSSQNRWKIDEQQRFEQARLAEVAALAIAEKEKAKTKVALEAAEAAQRIAERKYSIEEIEAATDHFAASRKIGEGGYGPVYKCFLDHTPVAIKVLRPDAAQGRSQFQQEVWNFTSNSVPFQISNANSRSS